MNGDILQRYETAQMIMQGQYSSSLVKNDMILPCWIENTHCFWYRKQTDKGLEFRLVNAEEATNALAFDHFALADSLESLSERRVDPNNLPIRHIKIYLSEQRVRFEAFGRYWFFHIKDAKCEEANIEPLELLTYNCKNPGTLPLYVSKSQQILYSNDNMSAVFVRDNNLWIRDEAAGNERALTFDGTADYSYARDYGMDTNVQALWSPDSRYLFTIRLDRRKVSFRPMVQYVAQGNDLHPKVVKNDNIRLAYPGDEYIESYKLVIIDVSDGSQLSIDYNSLPKMQYSDFSFGFFRMNMGWWSIDSRKVFFVDISRGAKSVSVIEWDLGSHSTRTILEEKSDTFVKLRHTPDDIPLFIPLPESDELIWFSERSGWGHLYLYDLKQGVMKHPITQGEWIVRGTLHYRADLREVLIQTAGRDSKISPYYRDVCLANIDSGTLKTVASGNFEHIIYHPLSGTTVVPVSTYGFISPTVEGVSPCGEYVVVSRSRVDTPPETVLFSRSGLEILCVERADVSNLPHEWQWPEPVKLKADDDCTDIYGVVFRPPGFTEKQSYPVIDFSFSMRSNSCTPQASFGLSYCCGIPFYYACAFAALGFVVVSIEGRGTSKRSKSFQDHHFGDSSFDNDPNDRIAGIKQLASRYPYMDINRVGITGYESAVNVVSAALKYSDFYKVAVSNCLVDARFSFATYSETYDGTIDRKVLEGKHFPEFFVEPFNGNLLLIQGMLSAVTPTGCFRLVEALQRANKDFDMLVLPNLGHAMSSYTIRRKWDYFVMHLQGGKPPHEFKLTTGEETYAHENYKYVLEVEA